MRIKMKFVEVVSAKVRNEKKNKWQKGIFSIHIHNHILGGSVTYTHNIIDFASYLLAVSIGIHAPFAPYAKRWRITFWAQH